MIRRIMHIDMDAFYASIEQVDHPELKGLPVIVGGSNRGVVCTASYEARKYGIRSAMPIFQARRLCPHGVFRPVRMRRYREISTQIMEILARVSPLVEQISIDEAYIDITGTEALHGPPAELAAKIKTAMYGATSLTCSIGIAPGKFLAKIASDLKKPDGLTLIEEQDVADFLKTLPVSKIKGIGAKTSQIFKNLGVSVAADILRFPLSFWVKKLGKHAVSLYEKAQGIDHSPVVPFSDPKSCSSEDTFSQDTDSLEVLKKWLFSQSEKVGRDLRRRGYRGKTVTLKIKFADFRLVTRSKTLTEQTDCTQVIFGTASQLLDGLRISRKVRLIGVGVSNLSGGMHQGSLFRDRSTLREEQLDKALDSIHEKYGSKVLKRGRLFDLET